MILFGPSTFYILDNYHEHDSELIAVDKVLNVWRKNTASVL